MRAFVLSGYGAISDHVRLTEIPDPVASPGEVLIEIHAASLNPIDFKLAHGALKRISNYKLPRPIGFDASGIVRSVGAGASKFKPGEAVYVRASRDTIGTFAEQIALSEKFIALKPATPRPEEVERAGGRLPSSPRPPRKATATQTPEAVSPVQHGSEIAPGNAVADGIGIEVMVYRDGQRSSRERSGRRQAVELLRRLGVVVT